MKWSTMWFGALFLTAGSIVAGILATHTDEEMEELFERNDWRFDWVRLFRPNDLMRERSVLDQKTLQRCIDQNIPDMTFLEAYQHTNRILNISVSPADSHQFPRLLNYLTAPNVFVRRAALASAAIPGSTSGSSRSRRAFTGKVVARPVEATPTSVTVASNKRSPSASNVTSTASPSFTREMNTSGMPISTSGRAPAVRTATVWPGWTFSLTSTGTWEIAPAVGASSRA